MDEEIQPQNFGYVELDNAIYEEDAAPNIHDHEIDAYVQCS